MSSFIGFAIGMFTFFGVIGLQAITPPTPDTPPIVIEDQHPIIVEDQNQYLSEKGNKMIEDGLTRPLSTIEKIDFDLSMMSRCISGFTYSLDKTPQTGHTSDFFLGNVRYYDGCEEGKFIVNFRVNYNQTKLEVITSKGEIVSPETWLATYKGIPTADEGTQIYYIKKISGTSTYSLTVDEATMYSGYAAKAVAMQETGCTGNKITHGDCAPSLNNGFYISNPVKTTQSFVLADSAKISIVDMSGQNGVELKKLSAKDFIAEFSAKGELRDAPYTLTISDNNVTAITQFYLP